MHTMFYDTLNYYRLCWAAKTQSNSCHNNNDDDDDEDHEVTGNCQFTSISDTVNRVPQGLMVAQHRAIYCQ